VFYAWRVQKSVNYPRTNRHHRSGGTGDYIMPPFAEYICGAAHLLALSSSKIVLTQCKGPGYVPSGGHQRKKMRCFWKNHQDFTVCVGSGGSIDLPQYFFL